jgi:hypothetical protein
MPDDPPPRRKGQPEPAKPRRPLKMFVEREVPYLLLMGLGCIISGVVVWFAVSGYERSAGLSGTWGIERPVARLMLFFWGLFTGTVLTGVVFRNLAMRRMTRIQARLVVQDMFWQETRREQERIHRWRRWFWKKRG